MSNDSSLPLSYWIDQLGSLEDEILPPREGPPLMVAHRVMAEAKAALRSGEWSPVRYDGVAAYWVAHYLGEDRAPDWLGSSGTGSDEYKKMALREAHGNLKELTSDGAYELFIRPAEIPVQHLGRAVIAVQRLMFAALKTGGDPGLIPEAIEIAMCLRRFAVTLAIPEESTGESVEDPWGPHPGWPADAQP